MKQASSSKSESDSRIAENEVFFDEVKDVCGETSVAECIDENDDEAVPDSDDRRGRVELAMPARLFSEPTSGTVCVVLGLVGRDLA